MCNTRVIFLGFKNAVSPVTLTGFYRAGCCYQSYKRCDEHKTERCCLKVTENLTDKMSLQWTKYENNDAKTITNPQINGRA